MTRIAFASCFSAQISPIQPVWAWIQSHKPDYLVLLGDSIYLDINSATHPMLMGDDEFAQHLFARYTAQLAVPEFKQLLKSLGKGRAFSIWDDHDFLWNDETGAEAWADPSKRSKIVLSSAFQTAFRATLGAGLAAGTFPAAYNDAVFWQGTHCPLASPSVQLPDDVWLHLTDGRTHRTQKWGVSQSKRTILGGEQKAALAAAYAGSSASSVHVFASGSVLGDYKKSYPQDWTWLLAQADKRRTYALSGDIHRNDQDAFANTRFPLYEATSSGAGVRELVVAGAQRQNFGLLDIDDTYVSTTLYANNQLEQDKRRRVLRGSWTPG